MLHENAAPGIHRIEDSFVNWYLVEDGTRLTAVDAGLPASWDSLHDAIHRLGRTIGDLEAVVLTHAHFDHLGFAERAPARSTASRSGCTRTTSPSPSTPSPT